jgi:hypothetical protein
MDWSFGNTMLVVIAVLLLLILWQLERTRV